MVSPLVLRLTAPLVIVSLLLLGVGVGAAWYVHHMQRNVSQGLRVNVSSMRAAEEVEILIREMRTQFDHFLMTGDRSNLQASPTFREETDHWLTVAEPLQHLYFGEKLDGPGAAATSSFWRRLDKLSR